MHGARISGTDGAWADRAEFTEHIAHLRGVDVVKTDGSAATLEVYVFGERGPDGRFVRIEEVTLMVSGSEVDRGLGSAR